MASIRISNFFLLLTFLSISIHFLTVSCVEFHVGGDKGWGIPSKNDQIYNDWASKNRFKTNDTLRFEYNKDSVLVVSEEDYVKCRSSKPMFFSNNGNTVFRLERSGLYYFISGVSGHCDRGMKMIIKVLEIETHSASAPQSANQTTTPHPGASSSAAPLQFLASSTNVITLLFALFGALFV